MQILLVNCSGNLVERYNFCRGCFNTSAACAELPSIPMYVVDATGTGKQLGKGPKGPAASMAAGGRRAGTRSRQSVTRVPIDQEALESKHFVVITRHPVNFIF